MDIVHINLILALTNLINLQLSRPYQMTGKCCIVSSLGFRFILLCALVVFVTDKILSKFLCFLLCRLSESRLYGSRNSLWKLYGGNDPDDEERRQLHNSDNEDSPRGASQPTLI